MVVNEGLQRKGTGENAAAVEIRGLQKYFGSILLYDDFSFDIEAGAVTVLTGPSGGGKTTLLRMIAGLEEPDGGRIRLAEGYGGSPAASGASHGAGYGRGLAEGITIVFQEDRLLPWLTVKENLRLVQCDGRAPVKRKTPCEEWEGPAEEKIEEILSLMELSGFGDYCPEQLSGGMRRRVAIGRALLYDEGLSQQGGLMLMDEPFKGLDDALKERIMGRLFPRWKARASAVVLVTHDRKDAEALGDRTWELSGSPVAARRL